MKIENLDTRKKLFVIQYQKDHVERNSFQAFGSTRLKNLAFHSSLNSVGKYYYLPFPDLRALNV